MSDAGNTAVLQVRNLQVAYAGNRAVDLKTLDVARNEMVPGMC